MKKLIINQRLYGTILTYVSMGMGLIVSLVYTPLMLRFLGQSEYGLYNLAASFISYLSVLSFGLGSTYFRYYFIYKNKDNQLAINKLNGMFLIIFIIISLITFIAGLILSQHSNIIFGDKLSTSEHETASILLIILAINLAIKFPNTIFVSYIRANERFIFLQIIEIVKIILNPFLILPVLFLGLGSIGLATATTIMSLMFEIIYIIYTAIKLKIKFDFQYFDVKLFKEMILFSSFIFINILIDQINWNVDKFLLGRFFGTSVVAIYSIALLFNTYYMQISTAISSVFSPLVHKIVELPDARFQLSQLFTKVGRIQLIVLSLFFSGFIVFGSQFIVWWAGPSYKISYYIVIILITSVTVPLIQNIGIEMMIAKNLHKFRSFLYLIIAIMNIIISIPLIKLYGGIGAAVGTAVSILLGNGLLMNLYYLKKVKLNIKLFWKEIILVCKGFIIPFTYGYILMKFIDLNHLLFFFLGITTYSIIYIISIWVLSFNSYEKEQIRTMLMRCKYLIWRTK